MSPKKSPLWKHFTLVNGDFRLAQCNYCAHVVRRGSENAPKSKCVNRTMQSHFNKCQPDIMVEVAKQQQELKGVAKTDVRDESVRGSVPLFKLTNREERAKFIKLVSYFCYLRFLCLLHSSSFIRLVFLSYMAELFK